MKKVSILIPAYNEEKSLPLLYSELVKLMDVESGYEWEILFVNDGSKDRTADLLRELRSKDDRVNYLNLSRNYGKECGMLAGFDYVTGDCMVIMDADLQHPPHVISDMLRAWENGAEDVYAERETRGKEPWLRKTLSLMFYNLLKRSTRIDILRNVGDFRLLDRVCIEALKKIRESERYTKGMFCWIGYKKQAVKFKQEARIAGKSSFNYSSLFNFAIEGIVSFTTAPLRMATFLGIFVALIALLFLVFTVVKTLVYDEPVAGYPSLMCVILFLGAVQLISIGVIGEYIGRIFNETKGRPAYIAHDYNEKKIYDNK